MRPTKVVPVVGTGWTRMFFTMQLETTDLASHLHLELHGWSEAQYALQIGDDGLSSMSIHKGDFLLFGTMAPLHTSEQIVLLRQEDEAIIRQAFWGSDTTLLRVPGDIYPSMRLPTENIRITAVLLDVIRCDEEAPLVRFR